MESTIIWLIGEIALIFIVIAIIVLFYRKLKSIDSHVEHIENFLLHEKKQTKENKTEVHPQ